jgi:hypothetical protein
VVENDKTISYIYDGRQITTGYPFSYKNDYSKDGNGIGIIK